MPKSFVDTPSNESAGNLFGRPTFGMVWGGLAGAMVGTGISMTIGLFYSSATALIVAVITISSLLGGVFGQIMANLLTEDVVLTGHAPGPHHATHDTAPMTDLCDHRSLKVEKQTKVISNQEVMAKINSIRMAPASLPPYRPDAQVFELIVSAAHTTRVGVERVDRGLKTLS